MTLKEILNTIYLLPPSSIQRIQDIAVERHFQKGHILLHADRIENKLYFIKKGVVRAFSQSEQRESTFWFGEEGDTILSMQNYVENKKSYESIELIVDCELYELDFVQLTNFYLTDIHLANLGRKLAEKELLNVERRMIMRDVLSAKERYLTLLQNQPSLLQRVPLKHIASYLGITQVSLSRIRKEK
ncbi:Crp/Fnr family transcriptional regulator [Myroides pelagicus]|uniref:Cyclic nucleotide-binding domain-containing protein n=1 Tax=Myroides pelagicus TaxID=270914 RepID=A0A7K1GJ16_9FLAO|nr:Crp/Fnr family transcriptional regulator [Myroides pelagicus]MEC4113691.1 Crp/Fnr family transcriptional regulator [Myroides pelagicus]MTH28887.1 cyclic nucleotide-binding domain-containing protein [Myroides pelagicus]